MSPPMPPPPMGAAGAPWLEAIASWAWACASLILPKSPTGHLPFVQRTSVGDPMPVARSQASPEPSWPGTCWTISPRHRRGGGTRVVTEATARDRRSEWAHRDISAFLCLIGGRDRTRPEARRGLRNRRSQVRILSGAFSSLLNLTHLQGLPAIRRGFAALAPPRFLTKPRKLGPRAGVTSDPIPTFDPHSQPVSTGARAVHGRSSGDSVEDAGAAQRTAGDSNGSEDTRMISNWSKDTQVADGVNHAHESIGNGYAATPRRFVGGAGATLRGIGLLVAALLVALAIAGSAQAQAPVSLGTADGFAVLGGSTVTNTGPTVVNGDLGVSPGSAVTGFPPGTVNGTIHAADAVAAQAQSDLTAAYIDAAGRACTVALTGQDLGGMTLTSGVYCFSSSAQLTGTLTLDAQGDPNACLLYTSD